MNPNYGESWGNDSEWRHEKEMVDEVEPTFRSEKVANRNERCRNCLQIVWFFIIESICRILQ